MTITKYRSIEEMPRPDVAQGDELVARIRACWRRARMLTPALDMPRGVQRFRSVEEAGDARQRAVLARMRATRE